MELTDEELVARVKKGDRTAFDKLVEKYRSKMFSMIYRMTGERESALDLTQDTFYKAFVNIKDFRMQSLFSSWLYRIAANNALNYIKRRKAVKFFSLSDKTVYNAFYEMDDNTEKSELNGALQQAISKLPAKQKLTFNLRFFENLPFGEIATILKKSESTVKTNYHRALSRLQKELKNFR